MRKLAALIALAALVSPACAASSPDRIAWEVFARMVAPVAGPGAKAVEFETWASDDDIYSGKAPIWPVRGAKHLVRSLAVVGENLGAHRVAAVAAHSCLPEHPEGGFPPDACIGEQVQHDWAVFRTIADNHLYSTAGLVQAYANGKPIAFPADSIVVKADWVQVGDVLRWQPDVYKSAAEVRRDFYTNTATMNGKPGEYALVGMSAQSKALPQWLWMTFEHQSNPGRCDVIGCHDDFGAVAANVAPAPTANTHYGPCAKTAALSALLGARHIDPVWSNYCLKGTQTNTMDHGRPTVLANSVIERMNKGVPVAQTSCITCHAYASFDAKGTPNYAVLPMHPIGPIDPPGLHGFKTHDYLWSILAAH